MKRYPTLILAALVAAFALSTTLAAPALAGENMLLNPQAGITWTNITSTDEFEIDDTGQAGWMIGGNIRTGSSFYFSPGVYYQKTSFEVTGVDDVTPDTITDAVGPSSIYIPVLVGLNLSSKGGNAATGLGLRVYAGPAVTFITSVPDNNFGVEKDDFESTVFGGVLGAGFDLTAITIDVNYELGLSNVFKELTANNIAFEPDNKQNVLRALVGLRF